jgi:hypothetical protein
MDTQSRPFRDILRKIVQPFLDESREGFADDIAKHKKSAVFDVKSIDDWVKGRALPGDENFRALVLTLRERRVNPDLLKELEAARQRGEDTWPEHLPDHPARFVGREAELSHALELLSRSDVRLIAVAGPGGVGKTQFAIELAARFHKGSRYPVEFVPLVTISDPKNILPEIARVLGIQLRPNRTPQEDIGEALRDRRSLLLVLDNIEHVAKAAEELPGLLKKPSSFVDG